MILIGIGSKARQGKNSVANYMQDALPEIKQYSFAEELKKYCRDHHDELLSQWQLAHQTKQIPGHKADPIYGCTAILQWYGTDVARKENPNRWVEAVRDRIQEENPDIAIITDVRFPNEAEYVKNQGGYLVQVIRRHEDGTQYLDPRRDPNHPSETALDEYLGWDYIIRVKDGDLDGLHSKALGVLKNIIMDYANANGPFDIAEYQYSIPDATGYSEDESYDRGDFLDESNVD